MAYRVVQRGTRPRSVNLDSMNESDPISLLSPKMTYRTAYRTWYEKRMLNFVLQHLYLGLERWLCG